METVRRANELPLISSRSRDHQSVTLLSDRLEPLSSAVSHIDTQNDPTMDVMMTDRSAQSSAWSLLLLRERSFLSRFRLVSAVRVLFGERTRSKLIIVSKTAN